MAKRSVEESSLQMVAEAIRSKGGTAAALSFPDGFAEAIAGITTGSPVAKGTISRGQEQSITISPGFVVKHMAFGCSKYSYNSGIGGQTNGYYSNGAGMVYGIYNAEQASTSKLTFSSTEASTQISWTANVKWYSSGMWWIAIG